MEPTSLPDAPDALAVDEPTTTSAATDGSSRREFIRGIAAAGASTSMAAAALDASGVADFFAENAEAAAPATPFSTFQAIAGSSNDALEVPAGFRADIIIKYGDEFANTDGTVYRYGYNCDFLAFFPINGSNDEGVIFVNHEYPSPFFQNGYKQIGLANGDQTKTNAEIYEEMESVGVSVVHIKKDAEGIFKVVSPSRYNRRIFGGDVPGKPDTRPEFAGPLAPGKPNADPRVGASAHGTVGNCSGGITPWGTALTCEENYDGYGFALGNQDFFYGWGQVAGDEYNATTGDPNETRKYGWVVEVDPLDPSDNGRKHTALGRFRHENTAFRVVPGKRFVLYMGDDQNNQGVYKFVSSRSYIPGADANNRRILEEGTLYIAKWSPEGRRRFASTDGPLLTTTGGLGEWVAIDVSDLYDTRLRLGGFNTNTGGTRRAKQGSAANDTDPTAANFAGRYNRDVTVGSATVNEWDQFFATNRPEDVEVDSNGDVLIAFTNNSTVNDRHGSVRRVREASNDPEATTFTWDEFANGGRRGGEPDPGKQGFSCADNLVVDKQDNVWVVTDISSSSIKGSQSPRAEYDYHRNNAIFMVPRTGPNRGVAFRFGNMPIDAEGTGPYFTPDEDALFVNVQHPGETTQNRADAIFGNPATYTSYWPTGNKTAGTTPATPLPTTVVITRVKAPTPGNPPTNVLPDPGPNPGPGTPPNTAVPRDERAPTVSAGRKAVSIRALLSGIPFTVRISEPGTVEVRLRGRVGRSAGRGRRASRGRLITLATARRTVSRSGELKVTLRTTTAARLLLRRRGAKLSSLRLTVTGRDTAGNVRTTGYDLKTARKV